jgi:hypothetical protein
LQKIWLFYFVYLYEALQPYSFTFISSIHLPLPHKYPPPLHLFYSLIFHFQFPSQSSKGFLYVFVLWLYFVVVSSTSSITL